MKSTIKYILHSLLGFRNYLFLFSRYKISTLQSDKKEKDFFHFLNLLPEDTIVLDIGANIGIMTVHLARRIKNIKVFAFEPMPANITAFKRIVNHYKLTNVTLFECALGNTEGEVEMVMPVITNVRMQGLSHVLHETITENNEGEKVKVPLRMLDKMPEIINAKHRISGIKIDVENFEFFVLDGARNLITTHKPIIYAELWDNENRANCFKLLKSFRYKTYVMYLNAMVEYDSEIHIAQNFIFLPENK